MSPSLNPHLDGCVCIRCNWMGPVDDYFQGCPICAKDGHAASMRALYAQYPHHIADPEGFGCRRYADWLVFSDWPSLGEGGTPVINLPRLSDALGLGSLLVKFEGANPTGSHKDRMSMLAVARARAVGAGTVVAASSGNAGVSLAAYAAAAGLDGVVVTTPAIDPNWRRAIEMHGARLIAVSDPMARWALVAEKVRTDGWYPITNFRVPPVGSNWFGVDGYRTVAFELCEQLGADRIDAVIVPTSRADLLWGICHGFHDLKEAGFVDRIPRVHAVEPFPRVASVLAGADYRGQFSGSSSMASIAGSTVTNQALDGLKMSGGTAVPVNQADVARDQKELARSGVYLERSSAAPLTAARALIDSGAIASGANVVLVGTSHGYKEHEDYPEPIPNADLSSAVAF